MILKLRHLATFSLFATVFGALAWLSFHLGSTHMQDAHAQDKQPTEKSLLQLREDDVVVGKKDAPVTIIEYSSLSCPSCAKFHNDIYPQIQEKYLDTGIAKFTNRAYPLNEPAFAASMLLACLDDEQAITFSDVLFEMQEKWAFSTDFKAQLKQIAAVGGMGAETFESCLTNQTTELKILQQKQRAADELGISSTPTIFVNGEIVAGGNSFENVSAAIEKAKAVSASDE